MSKFYLVKCECGNEQKVFSHASQSVACNGCKKIISQSSGGEAVILAEKIKELD